jgi:UDP-N-acetylglucosamine 2-epimerase (non-hydrolysing)
MRKILAVFGTRPEAIKMAPVVRALLNDDRCELKVCVTGQHREMLDQVLKLFSLNPDYDLNLMQSGQSLTDVTTLILSEIKPVFADFQPDLVLVHGDTSSAFAASLAAFYEKIPIAHVEAGLRTGNLVSPWPEEGNRKLIAALTQYHFAPTSAAKRNLLAENISENKIYVTGNTVIDALLWTTTKIKESKQAKEYLSKKFSMVSPDKKLILVTGHRRESFAGGLDRICKALLELESRHSDIQIVYPVHLNPKIQTTVKNILVIKIISFCYPRKSI